jgi:aminopeptidase-like protein
LDNLDFVNGAQITESLEIYRDVVGILDSNIAPISAVQHGEPQLGRRGLYPSTGGAINQPSAEVPVEDEGPDIDAMSWVCFMADGSHDLISIAERSELHFSRILNATRLLDKAGVVQVGEDQ